MQYKLYKITRREGGGKIIAGKQGKNAHGRIWHGRCKTAFRRKGGENVCWKLTGAM